MLSNIMKSKIITKLIDGLVRIISKIKYCKSSCCSSECMSKSECEASTDTCHRVT